VPLYFVYLAGAAKAGGVQGRNIRRNDKAGGLPEIEERIIASRPGDYVASLRYNCTSPTAIKVIELA